MTEANLTTGAIPTPEEAMRLALDGSGKLPVAFAVLKVELNAERSVATDAHYLYASKQYCRIISRDVEGVIGRSCRQVEEGNVDAWLERCRKVLVTGETERGFGYDALVCDWICFCIAPSAQEDCIVYCVMRLPVDDQQRQQLMSSADARTADFISDMLTRLSAEQDYEDAMNDMLRMMSTVIRADRLSVFECVDNEAKTSFELCAPGVQPQLGKAFVVPIEMLEGWFRNLRNSHVMLVPDVTVILRVSEPLYRWCQHSKVHSLLAAPFFSDGQIVGFLGAYNYQIDQTVDLNRLFGAVATFIAARMENHRLITSLERASSHDSLTGLLNRRGAQSQIDVLLESDPQASHVLALVDVDDFKRVNDVFGHAAGDEALRAIARRLEEVFSANEALISRNGGDEFLVFLSGDGAARASMLLADLSADGVDFEFEGVRHHLTLSVGYARYPEQTQGLRELTYQADVALYAVKLSGKAGFGKYVPEAEERLRPQLGFSAQDLLESFPSPVLVCDAQGDYDPLFASADLARLLGYADAYDLMRAARAARLGLVQPDDRERVADILAQCLSGERDEAEGFTFHARTKRGAPKELRARSRVVDIEETGSVLYLLMREP